MSGDATSEHCPLSRRVDDPTRHSWRFEGDDPYIRCVYCEQVRDAHTGRVISGGRDVR